MLHTLGSDWHCPNSHILWDLTRDENVQFTFHFFHHKIMKWPLLSPYFMFSVYSYWLLCIKLKYSEYRFSYTMLQCELYRDAGKGNLIANSVITRTSIDFIFTRYCLLLMFYWFISTKENLLGKINNYIEGARMSKSHNIALKRNHTFVEIIHFSSVHLHVNEE